MFTVRTLQHGRSRGVLLTSATAGGAAVSAWIVAVTQEAERPLLAGAIGLLAVASFACVRTVPVITFAAALAAPGLAEAAAGFDGHDDPFLLLVLLASFGLGRYGSARQQPWVGAGVVGLLALNIAAPGPFSAPAQLVFPVLLTGAPWGLGVLVRLALERERLAQDLAVQLKEVHRVELHEAALSERLSLAHDLHDVAGHTLSVVAIQAQVLRRRLERGDQLSGDDVLQLERQAGQAMDELRSVVKVLRPSGTTYTAPAGPTLEQLPQLIADCRCAGQSIDCSEVGVRGTLSPAVSLTAYRAVQEGLTNARRHGTDGPARLELRWLPAQLVITLSNRVLAPEPPGAPGGVGLIGLRERVVAHQGTVRAGLEREGEWVVRVELPRADPS